MSELSFVLNGTRWVDVLDAQGNPLEYAVPIEQAHNVYGMTASSCLACQQGEPMIHSYEPSI